MGKAPVKKAIDVKEKIKMNENETEDAKKTSTSPYQKSKIPTRRKVKNLANKVDLKKEVVVHTRSTRQKGKVDEKPEKKLEKEVTPVVHTRSSRRVRAKVD